MIQKSGEIKPDLISRGSSDPESRLRLLTRTSSFIAVLFLTVTAAMPLSFGEQDQDVEPDIPGPVENTSGMFSLPEEVIYELGNPLLHQRSSVKALTFSPDGKLLASGCLNVESSIRIWDVSTGELQQYLEVEGEKLEVVTAIAFTPDGKQLLSGNRKGELRVWDLATGRQVLMSNRHTKEIHEIVLSPGGKLLATGGHDGVIRISKLNTLDQHLGLLESNQTPPSGAAADFGEFGASSLRFTPDGKYLVAGISKSKSIVILNGSDGTLVRTIEIPEETAPHGFLSGELQSLNLNHDGTKIVASFYRYVPRESVPEGIISYSKNVQITNVAVWDFETGELTHELREDQFDVGFAYSDLSPDGETIALGLKNRVMLIDAASGETTRELPVPGWWGDSLKFSPDGQLLAASLYNTIGLWNTKSGKRLFVEQPGHNSGVSAVDYSSDGKFIVTGGGNRVHLWEAETGKHLFTRTLGTDAHLWDVEFSRDSEMFAVSGEVEDQRGRPFGTAVIWKVNGNEQATIQLPQRGEAVTFSEDGTRLVVKYSGGGWGDTRLELWSVNHPRRRLGEFPRDPFKGLTDPPAIKFSSNGRYVMIAEENGTVTKWDTSNEAIDSSFVADWRPEDWREDQRGDFRLPWIHYADFTSDGKFLVTSNVISAAKEIYVWNLETGQLVRSIEYPVAERGLRLKVAPDNFTIAASQVNYSGVPGSDTLVLFDMRLRSGRPILTLEPNDDRAQSFAFSPDSTRLVTGLSRGTALVWDIRKPSVNTD